MASMIRGKGRRAGVPAKFEQGPSAAQIEVFFAHLEDDFQPSVKEALRAANLTKKQYDALRKDASGDFAKRLAEWEAGLVEDIEALAVDQARRGDGAMTRFLLQTLRPDKYGAKAKLDVNITSDQVMKMSDEELAARAEELGIK
jgi:hypothetical protein